jgi:glycosyltransferase involved in cell wall biosynthesis
MTSPEPRVAAVTPYYNESEYMLRRCIDSVKNQTVKTDHFLVADGLGHDWLDQLVQRHLRLGKSHNDFGNTPRGLGSLLAASEGYDAIFYLDADNWIEPNHVYTCIQSATNAFGNWYQCDCTIAKRVFRRPNETVMPLTDQPGHVDTSCYFFLPGSFHLLSLWVTQPKYLSSLGDRFFYKILKSRNLHIAFNEIATVNYHCMWSSSYRSIGEEPPVGAKENINNDYISVINKFSQREIDVLQRLTGGIKFK